MSTLIIWHIHGKQDKSTILTSGFKSVLIIPSSLLILISPSPPARTWLVLMWEMTNSGHESSCMSHDSFMTRRSTVYLWDMTQSDHHARWYQWICIYVLHVFMFKTVCDIIAPTLEVTSGCDVAMRVIKVTVCSIFGRRFIAPIVAKAGRTLKLTDCQPVSLYS